MRVLATSVITAALSLPALNAQTGGPIDPPAGARIVLEAKGEGVQIYACSTTEAGLKWVLSGPDAKLLDASGKAIGSHSAGPTWSLADGGRVQGELVASKPAPETTSIAWLLLRAKPGTPAGSLASAKFIRRTGTHGGIAPASGCQSPTDAGKTARVTYTATYTFYSEQ
jgi:hypothetical protein